MVHLTHLWNSLTTAWVDSYNRRHTHMAELGLSFAVVVALLSWIPHHLHQQGIGTHLSGSQYIYISIFLHS